MLALLPEDEVPGSLFLVLFLERLPVEMSDHLVAKDFKNPSEMALHTAKLWDARRAQAVDSLLAAASTSPSRARGRERSDSSPVHQSQTPGPAGAGETVFPSAVFLSTSRISSPTATFLSTQVHHVLFFHTIHHLLPQVLVC